MQKVAGSNPVARSLDFVWTVHLAAFGGKMNGPGEAWAGVAESADATDLKSVGGSNPPCGFESRPRHYYKHFCEAASG